MVCCYTVRHMQYNRLTQEQLSFSFADAVYTRYWLQYLILNSCLNLCCFIMTMKLTLAECGIDYPTHQFRLSSSRQQCCQNSNSLSPAASSTVPIQQSQVWHQCNILTFVSLFSIYSYTNDIHFRNWQHKSAPFFRRRFLVPASCKSGTRFVWYRIPAPIRTLFYSKSESTSLSAIRDEYDRKNRRQMLTPENRVDIWSRFLVRVSWVLLLFSDNAYFHDYHRVFFKHLLRQILCIAGALYPASRCHT